MKETIELRKTDKGWVAKFSNIEIFKIFGSDTLPTGFTASAPEELVKSMIQLLNPSVLVTII